jgi:hypothetical protein
MKNPDKMSERELRNEVKTLRVDQQPLAFDEAGLCKEEPPVPGAVAVYRLGRGHYGLKWEHKGWLMPQGM